MILTNQEGVRRIADIVSKYDRAHDCTLLPMLCEGHETREEERTKKSGLLRSCCENDDMFQSCCSSACLRFQNSRKTHAQTDMKQAKNTVAQLSKTDARRAIEQLSRSRQYEQEPSHSGHMIRLPARLSSHIWRLSNMLLYGEQRKFV